MLSWGASSGVISVSALIAGPVFPALAETLSFMILALPPT